MLTWPSSTRACLPACAAALIAVAGIFVLTTQDDGTSVVLSEDLLVEELQGRPGFCGGDTAKAPPPLAAAELKDLTLKQVNVLIRHGDRTRCGYPSCWAKDEAKYDCDLEFLESPTGKGIKKGRVYKKTYMKGRNVLPGSCRLGQLTPIGYKQHYLKGKMLRRAYSKFLPSSYKGHESSFSLRSDDEPRTVLSGQALLAGMYPQHGHHQSSPAEWMVMDHVRENMFPNFHVCPRLNRAVKQAKAHPEFKKHWKKVHLPLKRKLSRLLGKDVHIGHIRDCLLTHICHKQAVPKQLLPLVPEINAEYNKHYDLVAKHTKKWAGGPLVGEVTSKLREAVKGAATEKFLLFSGHDTGPILPMLHAFGVADGHWPPYASSITIELYESSSKKQHVVRFVYNGKALTIPGCGSTLCPWKKFEAIAAKVTPAAGECKDAKLGAKLIHWDGMFAAVDEVDILGNNIKSSSPLQP
jgi:hypothetical protein